MRLGKAAEHSYLDANEQPIVWRFVGLADLVALDDSPPIHGSTLFSSFTTHDVAFLTRPRDELAVFWSRENGHRPAKDLLEEQ